MQRPVRTRPLRIPMRAFSRTEKVVAFCRVLLAAATALIVAADPRLPGPLPKVTAAVLGGYLAFSIAIFWLVRSERLSQVRTAPATVAADVAWITLLTLLTERGASPFFLLHVFVISSVSVRWGFGATVQLAVVMAVLYPLTAFAATHWIGGGLFDFQRYHIFRPAYLLVLGYLIGYLGEHELQAKHKLGLMLELMTTVRRRQPTGLVLGLLMRRVLRFFRAQHAILSVQDPESHRYFTWHLTDTGDRPRFRLSITNAPTCELPFAGDSEGILANDTRQSAGTALCYDAVTGSLERRAVTPDTRLPITAPTGLIVAPVLLQEGSRGHALLATTGLRRFTRDDLEYLLLLVTQATAGLEASRLQAKAEAIAVHEERARIARDLHDGFIQSLAAIDLRLEALKRLLKRNPGRVEAALDELHGTVEQGYEDVRRYLKMLRDTVRAVEGLGSAIDRVVAEFTVRHHMHVDVHRPPTDPDLPAPVVHELAQIILEALTNAARHGRATHALVRVSAYETHLVLLVRDDGGGFGGGADPDGFVQGTAQPWSIRERAALLGAELHVRSRPGMGTEISVSVPRGRRPLAGDGATPAPREDC